jgi:heptosyltransferase II
MPKKILIIQTAFLGDVILTLPIIQSLKTTYPDCLIDFLCIPYTVEVLQNNANINEVIVYDKHKSGKINGIKKICNYLITKKYELAIIPHRSIRSGMIALLAKIPIRIGFEKLFFNWLYSKTVRYNSENHEVERNLSLIDEYSPVEINKTPQIITKNESILDPIDNIKKAVNISEYKKLIAVAPGSIWFTKRWPIEYYYELCVKLYHEKFLIIFIGGKNDKDTVNILSSKISGSINLCGELNIKETAVLLRRCNLLIANDSAAVHIASSVGLVTIDIYGPTVPEIGFSPLSEGSKVLGYNNLNCRPCQIHGSKKCPVGSFDCMKNITPQFVFEKAKEILGDE